MTRKKLNYNPESPMGSRFEKMLNRDLKDHRYNVYFGLNEAKKY